MVYGDEHIISERIVELSTKTFTIDNVVEIDGVRYRFAEREFESVFSIVLPELFAPMPIKYAKIKYPYEDRPPIIISDEDAMVDFAFRINASSQDSLKNNLIRYKNIGKRLNPSNVFFTQKIYPISNNRKIACYDFRSPALDGDVYNFNFFMDLHDKELFGWFHCPIELQDKWEPLVRQMVQTIKPLPQEEQE